MYKPRIVSSNYKDDVRIMMGLSDEQLPNDRISGIVHLAPAENDVIRAVPNWESVDDKISLYNAVIAGVAYYLCSAVYKANPNYETIAQKFRDRMWCFIGNLVPFEGKILFKAGF